MTLRLAMAALILAASLPAQLSQQQRARAERIQTMLLAPCCYSEPVSRHRSDVSLAMREEIGAMVAGGKSDQEILDFYKQRYGLKILVEPEGGRWWWMHVVPVLVTALGLAFVIWVLRRMLRPLPSS